MPLAIGARVGAYEVVSLLGEGGMGQVYRARDARLKRDIALKVLPASALADADRRARFEREAQVLAALDHPNIATVFGIEETDGAPVIVMELVEGPTLDHLIGSRPLPLDEALGIAVDLCHGLAAAHDAGVVHRDLKPANIKVRPDGVVKILDFGLAMAPADTASDVANSPTVLNMHTMPGAILGTAAYMSPEQARGRPVDARADIWAFGCVFYEMLTGRQAFGGDTTTDILAAVVQSEPDWTALPAALPARADELLRRCLQKAAKDRQRDIGDAAYQLQRARGASSDARPSVPHTSLTSASGASAPTRANTTPPGAGRSAWTFWLGPTIAFAAGAAAVALWLGTNATAPAPTGASATAIRTSIVLPPGTTLALGRGSAVTISPDGTRVVYAATSGDRTMLYRRDLDRFESIALPGTEGATNPFFSPDGRWVGFFAERRLKKVSLDGGAPVNVTEAPNPRGEAWGPDDTMLVVPTNGAGLSRVSAGGGTLAPFSTLTEGEGSHRWPRFLPGNAGVLFSVWNDTGWEPARIDVQSLDGTNRKVIIERNGGYPRYVREGARDRGFLVYAREDGLMAAPFDTSTLTTTGTAVPVFDGLITNLSGGAHFDVSDSGTLVYAPGASNEASRELRWVSLAGAQSPPITIQNFSSRIWRLSSDDRHVLFSNTTGGPTRHLWQKDLVSGRVEQLTQGENSFSAIWSSDSAWIVYLKGYPEKLVRRLARLNAVDQELSASPAFAVQDVSPDGRWLLVNENRGTTGIDVVARRLPDGPPDTPTAAPLGDAQPVAGTAANESGPRFSPDGRWVVYQSNATGRLELYARAFPAGDREFQLTTTGGFRPQWHPSGRDVIYRSPDNAMMAVTLTTAPDGLAAGPPRRLFDATGFDEPFAVSADGTRLLMMPALTVETAATEIRLIVNFLDELHARVK